MKGGRVFIGAMMAIMILAGCLKDELDPAKLTHSPFDPDYTGETIFSLDTAFVESYFFQGATQYRVRARIRVNMALFNDTPFHIRAFPAQAGGTTTIQSLNLEVNTFSVVSASYTPGATYCWDVRVGRQGSWGGGNDICATIQ